MAGGVCRIHHRHQVSDRLCETAMISKRSAGTGFCLGLIVVLYFTLAVTLETEVETKKGCLSAALFFRFLFLFNNQNAAESVFISRALQQTRGKSA
jgi:hypothetical protein